MGRSMPRVVVTVLFQGDAETARRVEADHGETPAFIIAQPQPSTVQLRPERAIFFAEELNDVTLLSIKRPDGAELLVPFVSAIVTTVSLAEGTIDIDPPDGLLNLEDL